LLTEVDESKFLFSGVITPETTTTTAGVSANLIQSTVMTTSVAVFAILISTPLT